MAGAGYKLFNTGDVLTAAQVNTYLQEQAVMRFATTTARTTALSGVLSEGMVTYIDATDSLEFYNGSAWVAVNTTAGDITGITTGATSGLTGGVTSGTADLKLNTTAKGGLLVGTGSGTVNELSVGTNNQVLTVDSTTATGLKWAAASGGTSTFVGCSVQKTTDQSVSSGTATLLTWDSENFDTDNFHSNVSNTSRFTIPSGKGGYYLVSGSIQWDANANGIRQVQLFKNGTKVNESLGGGSVSSANRSAVSFSFVVNVVATDYIELYGRQDSGSSLNVLSGTISSTAQITYLGA